MNNFQSVFDSAEEIETDFDTVFGSEEDGSLVDTVCGFNESGECETDFEELHQTQDNADPDDIANDLRVDNETNNTPDGAEGTDTDPAIDLALGETSDTNQISDTGVKGKSDADNFYDDYNEPEEPSATTGEGPDVNMNNQNIDDEFEKMVESVTGQINTNKSDNKEKDQAIESLDSGDKVEQNIKESDEYEEGDSDLVDLVAGIN